MANLFPLKWLRMTRNGQFHMIYHFSNLFPPKWLRMTRNGQFHLICNFSNLFPPKWLKMTQNGQFRPIRNFSNLSPPKWLRMTWNGQFCMAKIKCTLIQGNFYERLPFYMDSCALSPTTSLFSFLHIFAIYINNVSNRRMKQLMPFGDISMHRHVCIPYFAQELVKLVLFTILDRALSKQHLSGIYLQYSKAPCDFLKVR